MTDFQDDVSEDFYETNWLVLDVNTRMVRNTVRAPIPMPMGINT